MKNPIFTALLTLFIAACDNGLSVDMAAEHAENRGLDAAVQVFGNGRVRFRQSPAGIGTADRKYGSRNNGPKNRTYHFFG